jgi:hypothetical protein
VIAVAASGTVIVLESVRLPVIFKTAVVDNVPLNPVKFKFTILHEVVIIIASEPSVTFKLMAAVDPPTIVTVLVVPVVGDPVKLNVFVAVMVAVDKAMLNTVPLVPVILTTPVVPVTK